MKNIVRDFVKCFLLILVLTGCGTADSISNSAGPSSPSNIVMNLEANPPSVDPGGSAIITVTLTNATTGVPAAGVLVTCAFSGPGTGECGETDSNGQGFLTLEGIDAPTTVTFIVEDISASIRINVNA